MKVTAEYIPPLKSGAVRPVGARPESTPARKQPDKMSFDEHLLRAMGVAAIAGFAVGVAVSKRDEEEDEDGEI